MILESVWKQGKGLKRTFLVCYHKETKLVKVGDKRSYENMTYVGHLCHESFASKIDLYKDYLKHIAFFKCEIYKSDKIQFGTRREYVSHMKNTHFIQGKIFQNVKTVLDSVIQFIPVSYSSLFYGP